MLVGDRVDPPRVLFGSVRGGLERIRPGGPNAEQALDRGDTEALERGNGEVAVEIVAVGRVDIVAQPDPRIGDLDRGAGELANQRRQRRRFGLDALLEPERWLALEQTSLEPEPRRDDDRDCRGRRSARHRARPRSARAEMARRARTPDRSGGRAARSDRRVRRRGRLVRAPRTAPCETPRGAAGRRRRRRRDEGRR